MYRKPVTVQEVYFGSFIYGKSEEYLIDVFTKQLYKRNSVIQDYLIALWMAEHQYCNEIDKLKSNYKYYENIDLNSLYSDSTKLFWVSYYPFLKKEILKLEDVCE